MLEFATNAAQLELYLNFNPERIQGQFIWREIGHCAYPNNIQEALVMSVKHTNIYPVIIQIGSMGINCMVQVFTLVAQRSNTHLYK